jgi:phosphate starvation-inducible PhoH-like protein
MPRSKKRNNDIPKLKSMPSEKDFDGKSFDLKEIKFKPRNEKQKLAWQVMSENEVSFIIGEVGSGKTKLATLKALQLLQEKKYKKIILLRPVTVSETEQLGFLKGDMDDKIAPLILPMRATIEEEVGKLGFESLLEQEKIIPYSLAHVEGLTYKNAIVILDEFQNTTPEVLKMVLTRIDDTSKAFILGDRKQIKLRKKSMSASHDTERFRDVQGIGFVEFDKKDIVRGKITKLIMSCYPEDEEDESVDSTYYFSNNNNDNYNQDSGFLGNRGDY